MQCIKFGLIFSSVIIVFAVAVLWHITPNMVDPKPVSVSANASRFLVINPKPTRTIGLDNLSVYAYLAINHVYERKIVLKQTILETGWYTSKNCRDRNNIFGMKGGKETPTNPEGYKIYPSWKHSVKAYKSWQERNFDPEYCGSYYDFLEHIGYATSPEYVEKLKGIKL